MYGICRSWNPLWLIWFARISVRPDMGVATEKMKEMGLTPPSSWASRIVGQKVKKKVAATKKDDVFSNHLHFVSLVFSMVAVDLSMSLAPHFFANMFPAW